MRPAASSHISEAERQGIIDLVHDLPAVWRAKTTTHAESKHVVRLLIKDVMLTKLEKAVKENRVRAEKAVKDAQTAVTERVNS